MRSQIYKSNHLVEIFSKLNKERKSTKKYCDVTLTAEGHDFQIHKCILAAFSMFYNKLFSIEMKERYENKANIQGVSPETMEIVLNFVYTCNVEITSENVYDLLEASNYMEIPNLKMYCCEFLLGEVNATNCLRMRAYSKLYNLEKLTRKANELIAEEFQSVISEKEFLELNFDEVAELIQLEEKKTSSEEIVYYALIGWMKHDITAREKYVVELFRLVKLEKLSWDFVQKTILLEDLIMNSHECTRMALQSTVSRITIEQTNPIATEQEGNRHGNVGMEDGRLPDGSITASSSCEGRGCNNSPHCGRLNQQPVEGKHEGCWTASKRDVEKWIQVLLGTPIRVRGVVTQGSPKWKEFVKTYQIAYGNSEDNMQTIKDESGNDKIFQGNNDMNTEVTNMFPKPVTARYFRLIVQTWNNCASLRLEFLL